MSAYFDYTSANKWRIRRTGGGWWAAYQPRCGVPFGFYATWDMAMAAVSYSMRANS